MACRFLQLFEAHGIHRNQIPRTFGHNLTLVDIETPEALLRKLNEEILNAACVLFNIERTWLDCAGNQVYPIYDFYKKPYEFIGFLEEILFKNQPRISTVLLTPYENNTSYQAVILLAVTVGYVENAPYYRYYILNNWFLSYWKSRAYLTSCIAYCWSKKVLLHGLYVSNELISSIATGENLFTFGSDGIYKLKGQKWHPEDMTIKPNKFLNGINPEYKKFGIKAGLNKWLELESKGLLRSGLENEKTRKLFEEELKKYV